MIGPGLGKDPYMYEFFPHLVKSIGRDKVVIFDADGIYYLSQYPELAEHLKNCKTIITPNSREINYIKPYLNVDISKVLSRTTNQD